MAMTLGQINQRRNAVAKRKPIANERTDSAAATPDRKSRRLMPWETFDDVDSERAVGSAASPVDDSGTTRAQMSFRAAGDTLNSATQPAPATKVPSQPSAAGLAEVSNRPHDSDTTGVQNKSAVGFEDVVDFGSMDGGELSLPPYSKVLGESGTHSGTTRAQGPAHPPLSEVAEPTDEVLPTKRAERHFGRVAPESTNVKRPDSDTTRAQDEKVNASASPAGSDSVFEHLGTTQTQKSLAERFAVPAGNDGVRSHSGTTRAQKRLPENEHERPSVLEPITSSLKDSGQGPQTYENGELDSGTSRAQDGHKTGTRWARDGYESRPTRVQDGHETGTSRARPGHKTGTTRAQKGVHSGTTQPQDGHDSGTTRAQKGVYSGTTWPKDAFDLGTTRAQKEVHSGTTRPQLGHRSSISTAECPADSGTTQTLNVVDSGTSRAPKVTQIDSDSGTNSAHESKTSRELPRSPTQRKLLYYLFKQQVESGLGRTPMLSRAAISEALGIAPGAMKTTLSRLIQAQFLKRVGSSQAWNCGGTSYVVPRFVANRFALEAYEEPSSDSGTKSRSDSGTIVQGEDRSSSRSINTSTSTTPGLREAQQLESLVAQLELEALQIGVNDLLDAFRRQDIPMDRFMESVEHLEFAVRGPTGKTIRSPQAFFRTRLAEGYCGRPAGFIPAEVRRERIRLEEKQARLALVMETRKEAFLVDFEIWKHELTSAKRAEILQGSIYSPGSRQNLAVLRDFFAKESLQEDLYQQLAEEGRFD